METPSVWRTWKPYAVIAILAVAGVWWWNAQSPFAALKDGAYDCIGVYVDEAGKYQVLTDDSGDRYYGTAQVENGELVQLAGDTSLSSAQLASLTLRSTGNARFHVTDDPAMKMYNAIACEHVD